jgi:hypothetical protein
MLEPKVKPKIRAAPPPVAPPIEGAEVVHRITVDSDGNLVGQTGIVSSRRGELEMYNVELNGRSPTDVNQEAIVHKIIRDGDGLFQGVTGLIREESIPGRTNRDKLYSFYEQHDPEKVKHVDTFLEKLSWDRINMILQEKYGCTAQ